MSASTWPKPCHRVITTHAPDDTDGSSVALNVTDVALRPVLDGAAAIAPLFSSMGLPATSTHTLSDSQIIEATDAVKGVALPGGVNGQITDVTPNFRIDMHRTNSIDYNIMIAGSAWLITPTGKRDGGGEERTLVKAGEIVVQRGTLHAWESGPEGARWITVVVAAKPVEVNGRPLAEVDFQ